MTRIKVSCLVWDRKNIEHIKKHGVVRKEVEIAAKNLGYHKQTYNKRYLFVGRSGKRILSVVISKVKSRTYYVISARDSDRRERKNLYDKENKK